MVENWIKMIPYQIHLFIKLIKQIHMWILIMMDWNITLVCYKIINVCTGHGVHFMDSITSSTTFNLRQFIWCKHVLHQSICLRSMMVTYLVSMINLSCMHYGLIYFSSALEILMHIHHMRNVYAAKRYILQNIKPLKYYVCMDEWEEVSADKSRSWKHVPFSNLLA